MMLDVFPAESIETRDPLTGARIRQLTNYFAHDWHLYFTDPGWWDNGNRLLFNSHRFNEPGLFSIDLRSYEITRIASGLVAGFINPVRNEVYCTGQSLVAVGLETGERRELYKLPEGFRSGNCSCTADGRFVCLGICEMTRVDTSRMNQGYVGFREYAASRPLCRILKVPVDGGKPGVLIEKQCWISHVNTSPTRPDMLTYCHEGPWDIVEQRMWGLDTSSGRTWPIRPQTRGEALGHEYWLQDGTTVGYHGRTPEGPIYGFTTYDNTERTEAHFPDSSHHFHSNTRELIVGEGQGIPYMLLWRFDGKQFDGPRVLCKHRSSRHIQETHVHPRISPDNTYVIYTSDDTGYGNVYQAFIPEFESLPELRQVLKAQ